MIETFQERNYSYFIRIYINRFEYLRGIIKDTPGFRSFPKENLSFNPIPKEIANSIVQRSKVVVDVHHPKQTGLSIRVMEVLGAGVNIVTTNKAILNESFYSPQAIGIIENCQLPNNISQLLSSKATVNVEPYEIKNWVETLVTATK